ncbi:hypothetical protein [Agromyces ramosus]|uniref:hypothetical protein n=1 Tax=Agromyces ramosus TaxID=33879 RepID=UPI0027D7FDC0|nr:hypothetical protein [Agromyces ramosus]
MPVDIGAHARRGASRRAWLVVAAIAIAGIVVVAWAVGAMVDDPDSRSVAVPLVGVCGFLLVLTPVIFTGFALQGVMLLRRADRRWPGSSVVPFVITMQLPGQVDDVSAALGRRLYLPAKGYGLLVANTAGIRVLSGWGILTDLNIPRTSLSDVELGVIEFPFGKTVSIDVHLNTPGDVRVSFMPTRTSGRFWGAERPAIVEQYVEELRRALELGPVSAQACSVPGRDLPEPA